MGFTTQTFLFVFLPISILLYLLSTRFKNVKIQNGLLIVLNIAFYAWSSLESLAFFLALVVVTYIFGSLLFFIKKSGNKTLKWMIFAIVIILIPLIYSKYISVFLLDIGLTSSLTISLDNIIVPIGISFVTFECISYILDIKNEKATPGNFFDFLLFISLFPKLVSGPIVLWRDFQNQIYSRKSNILIGIEKIIIGYAEKAIIADTFGAQIQLIEAQACVDTQTLWLKAVLYFFQLYFDFSGYSKIAIGLCNIFGFDIKDNFNFPYISKSVSEFWRRWHISLGTWFREYVYIPLGGNRTGNVYVNLFIVFLLTGIWHGASWTFVIWGVLHGLAVIFERRIKGTKLYIKTPGFVKWILTVLFIFFTWIIFSSSDIQSAFDTFRGMFDFSATLTDVNFTWQFFLTKKIGLLLIIAAFVSICGFINFSKLKSWISKTNVGNIVYRVSLIILLVLDILFIVNSTYSPFLYFQF